MITARKVTYLNDLVKDNDEKKRVTLIEQRWRNVSDQF